MSGPQIPHIELPEIPIPFWGVAGVLALFFLYSVAVQIRAKKVDSFNAGVALGAAAGFLVLRYYLRAEYWETGDPPTIKPFGTLVALGVYIGSVVAVRHGKERGLDLDKMNTFIFWVVGLGFVGGHMLDALFYTPEKVQADPWYLIKIWGGLSSFGGFTGAVIGAVLYKVVKKDDVLPYVDTVCSAFPLAWVFGRSGCASVHDHPGKISAAWYAVKCVDKVPHGEGAAFLCSSTQGMGRYDLGLYEMLLTIPLAVSFWWLWRSRPRSIGFFAGWMCILYAPVRFSLDFFRADHSDHVLEVDPRHLGLTPAQWACFGLIALGVVVIRLGRSAYPAPPATYAEAQAIAEQARLEREEEAEADDEDDEDERPVRPAPKVSTKSSKLAKGERLERPSGAATSKLVSDSLPAAPLRKKKRKKIAKRVAVEDDDALEAADAPKKAAADPSKTSDVKPTATDPHADDGDESEGEDAKA